MAVIVRIEFEGTTLRAWYERRDAISEANKLTTLYYEQHDPVPALGAWFVRSRVAGTVYDSSGKLPKKIGDQLFPTAPQDGPPTCPSCGAGPTSGPVNVADAVAMKQCRDKWHKRG
jgi:hypothetical protein